MYLQNKRKYLYQIIICNFLITCVLKQGCKNKKVLSSDTAVVLYKNPTFRAPRTHKETASFALRSTFDFVVWSSVNAVSCNALHVKACSC